MKKKMALLILSVIMFSCSNDENKENIVGEEGIITNIEISNLSSSGFPWAGVADGKIKRWDVENQGLIPVKINGEARAITAMDEIEEVLGRIIFDRTSIANTPDNEITRGLIVSVGTAIGPGGVVDSNTCGMVSGYIGDTSYPSNFCNENGVINTKLYVHFDSAGCTADLKVVIHEFGHALGVAGHFDGFGIGDAINGNFWNVLYNIYANEIGTVKESLVIEKVK